MSRGDPGGTKSFRRRRCSSAELHRGSRAHADAGRSSLARLRTGNPSFSRILYISLQVLFFAASCHQLLVESVVEAAQAR